MRSSAMFAVLALALLWAHPLAGQDLPEAPAEAPPTEVPAPTTESLTPRETFDRVMTLFSQAHHFTEEEALGLADLRIKLADSGDRDLAADLDLLTTASRVEAQTEADRLQARTNLADDARLWDLRLSESRGREFWRGVRDGGLATFTAATISTLILATMLDQEDAMMKNGYFFDWQSKQQFQTSVKWALAGSATTMFFSLFPLLWGEARQ